MSSLQGFMCEVCYSYHIGSDIFPSHFFFKREDAEAFMLEHNKGSSSGTVEYGVDVIDCAMYFDETIDAKKVFVEMFALVNSGKSIMLHTGPSESRIPVWVSGDFQKLADDPTTHTGRRFARKRGPR